MRSLMIFLRDNMYMPLIIVAFYVVAIVVAPFDQTIEGFINILTSTGLLLTDFIYVSSLSAAFFATGTLTLFNFILVKKVYGKIDGLTFAGLLCVLGFSFFGKTILNTVPVQVGVYLYTVYKKELFKDYMPTTLFATGIAPVVSFTMFGLDILPIISIPLGISLGIFCGFITPVIAKRTVKFYDGLNIFNIGFASGLIATIIYAFYGLIGVNVVRNNQLTYNYSVFLFFFILIISTLIMIISFIYDRSCIKKCFTLSRTKDQCTCDYTSDYGFETSLFNIGLIGLVCLLVTAILDVKITGPLAGAIFATMGFAGYRVHIKNYFPLLLGTIFAGFLLHEAYSTSVVIAIFLSAGLSPIVGKYGFVSGLISGIMIISLVPYMLELQGGFGIYNIGFVTGFVGLMIVPLCDAFFKVKK